MSDTNALAIFEFDGDRLPTVTNDDGLWLELRPLCDVFNKDVDGQARTLQKEPWAQVSKFETPNRRGEKRPAWFIHQDSVTGWLFGMQTAGMAPALATKVNHYKAESARALRDYWLKGGAVNPRATLPQVEQLRAVLDEIVLKEPSRYEVLWKRQVVCAIGAVYRLPVDEGDPTPVWFGNVSGHLYRKALTYVVTHELRDRSIAWAGGNGGGYVHLHRMLTPEARQYMNAEVGFIKTLADQSRARREFWARVDHRYEGKPFQHGFGFLSATGRRHMRREDGTQLPVMGNDGDTDVAVWTNAEGYYVLLSFDRGRTRFAMGSPEAKRLGELLIMASNAAHDSIETDAIEATRESRAEDPS